MAEVLNEILKELPDGKISDAVFEGANIVIYTKDYGFFMDSNDLIKSIVQKIKNQLVV